MKTKAIADILRDRRGLTLVELMIAIAVFTVILGVVMGFVISSRNSYTETRERARTQQSMRAVMALMTSEVRSAGCDPRSNGFDTFGLADATQIQTRADLNGDSDVADQGPDETVTYTYNAATDELSRDNGTGAQVILRGVTGVNFTYYDENGAQLAAVPLSALDRARVRSVEVLLQGETKKGEPVDYTTRIALRNN